MLSLPRAVAFKRVTDLPGVNAGRVFKTFILEDERGQKGQQGLLNMLWLDISYAPKGVAGCPAL